MTIAPPLRPLAVILVAVLLAAPVPAADSAEPVDFARDVLPVLSNKCFVCHGPDAKDKDLVRLDSFAGATADRGGYQVINPRDPGKSEILSRLHSEETPMPPQEAEKQLTEKERDVITRWVRQGGAYATHWAFVVPKQMKPAGDAQPIDSFLLARLKEKDLEFAPEADRSTLARRVALVLTGLPPEPEQLDRFLADTRPDSYERLVDELLASSRLGEHQARYWLDAVRYGDTHGLHLDNRRGIYPYRDWVVSAFNNNLPLDEFITWQLAGDLLPDPSVAQLVATGYVRLNQSTGEGGAIAAEFQMKNNFDRVETLGTVFLGMSLTCARCHTHKYDPIPQTSYYRLLAFFNNTAEPSLDGNKYEYGPVVKAPAHQQEWQAWSVLVNKRKRLLAEVDVDKDLKGADAKNWRSAAAKRRLAMMADAKGLFGGTDHQKRASELAARFSAAEKTFTTSLVAKDLPEPRPTRFLRRGEYDQPQGEPLEPGIVEVMGAFPQGAPRNRLGLAQWLTSRQHPLVARVLVNRIWQRVFGYGLVRTPEDFGLQGQQPTHPNLLDWLAVELHDSRWNQKHLLRLMVTSQAFRQQSHWRREIEDPENRLFARGPSHRLDAEVLRDLGLWASGLLDPHMGGEGVKPYQPAGMWKALAHPGSNTKQYVQDKGRMLYRRSLYVYWKRTSPHPMMTLFDAPDRESSCVRRSRTNTPLQSLGLLNETQRIEMARMLAERLLREDDNTDGRLNRLFRLLACREPTDRERDVCTKLYRIMNERYVESPEDAVKLLSTGDIPRDGNLDVSKHAAWTQVCGTILASDVAILLY